MKNEAPPNGSDLGTSDETARITNQEFPAGHTSNDLWSRLDANHPPKAMNYEVVAQNADEVQDLENAPPFSMGPYLVNSGQMHLMTVISIYSERGASRDQVRLLYMNANALLVWRAMGRTPTVIGARYRPPRTSLLMYGMPFSD
jgi:hypothetical protein